jgi:hypothetical protein
MANNKNPNDKQPGENPEGNTITILEIWPGRRRRMRNKLPKTVTNSMSTKTSPPVKGNEVAN